LKYFTIGYVATRRSVTNHLWLLNNNAGSWLNSLSSIWGQLHIQITAVLPNALPLLVLLHLSERERNVYEESTTAYHLLRILSFKSKCTVSIDRTMIEI